MRIADRDHVLSFEGGHVVVGAPAELALTTALTFAAWIKPTSGTGLQATILSKNYTAYEPQVEEGRFVFERGPSYRTTTRIAMGEWVHVAATFDATLPKGNIRLYVNGGLDRTYTNGDPLATSRHHLLIGKRPAWNDGLFAGLMGGVAIWRSARSAWQVAQDVHGRIHLDDPDLVAYWRMDEGSGTRVGDASPNGHHGTIDGDVRWVALDAPIAAGAPADRAVRRHTSVARLAELLDQDAAPRSRAAAAPEPAPAGAQVERRALPPSGRGGEAAKFLNRVELYNQQRVQRQAAESADRVQEAKAAKAAKVQQAHAEAVRRINSTRFDYLYFISGGRIHRVDPKHAVEPFFVGLVSKTESTVAARLRWQKTGVKVEPGDTLRVRYLSGRWSVSPAASNLTAAGSSQYRAKQGYALAGQPEGSLIGRVGQTIFFLGTNGTVPAGLRGELQLITNDDVSSQYGGGYGDNSGEIVVELTLQKAPVHVDAVDLAIDQARRRVFWAQATPPFTVHAAGLDGTGHQVLAEEHGAPVTAVAVDAVNQRVYYIAGTGAIHRVGYDGSDRATILDVSAPAQTQMWQIVVDDDNQRIYWTNDYGIWRARLDGANPEMVVPAAEAPHPIDLAVDGEDGNLYWIDKELGMVRRAGLDGSEPHDLFRARHPHRGLVVDEVTADPSLGLSKEVYWTAWEETIRAGTPGIVGHWKLDEGRGDVVRNAVDDSELPLGAARRDAVELPPNLAPPRTSLRFAGPADHVRVPQQLVDALSGGSFTVSAWVRPAALTNRDAPILAMDAPFEPSQSLHLVIRNKKPYLGFYANDQAGATVIPEHTWTHVAFVYDADIPGQLIYVNGKGDTASAPHSPLRAPEGKPARIGSYANFTFQGHIADVHIVARALTPAEIAAGLTEAKPGDVAEAVVLGPTWDRTDAPPVVDRPRAVLAFDGENAYVPMGTATQLGLTGGSFTVECWLKTTATGELAVLGTDETVTNKGLHLVVRNDKPYLGFYANDLAGRTRLEPGTWHHVAWRYDLEGREQAVFVDGLRDARRSGAAAFAGTGLVYLGRSATRNLFSGSISDLRIWNVARTDAEIRGAMRSYRETFAIRGPVDGGGPPEHLFEVPAEAGLQLVSKYSLAHEQRLLAYRARKEAQEKAARDVAAAHTSADQQVATKHAELARTHVEQTAAIDAKKAEHTRDRADNRTQLAQAQDDSRRRIDQASQAASRRRQDAEAQASDTRRDADARAARMKSDARSDRDAARRARDSHR